MDFPASDGGKQLVATQEQYFGIFQIIGARTGDPTTAGRMEHEANDPSLIGVDSVTTEFDSGIEDKPGFLEQLPFRRL
jgi:hypothetical protein